MVDRVSIPHHELGRGHRIFPRYEREVNRSLLARKSVHVGRKQLEGLGHPTFVKGVKSIEEQVLEVV